MKQEKTRTDEELAAAIHTFSDMLYRLILSYTGNPAAAEDILQDVFVSYLTDPTRFRDREHEKAWLIRVSVNGCKKYHRSFWNRNRTPLEDMGQLPTREQSEVLELVMALPTKYRLIIHLYYYEELSVREIGQLLHLKESTVQSRLHRARQKLRKEMEVSQ